MKDEADRIHEQSLFAKDFLSIRALFDEAILLKGEDDRKACLLQSLAHRAFMMAACQTKDWNALEDLYRLHCSVGFTRQEAKLAAEIAYAECALEFADIDVARNVICLLECTAGEYGEKRGAEERHKMSLLVDSMKDQLRQKAMPE